MKNFAGYRESGAAAAADGVGKPMSEPVKREPGKQKPPRRKIRGLWFLLAAVCYLAPLGAGVLVEPDEARYGEIAREMIESGDWLTPRLNYVKYFEKPPLYYWATGLSLAVFGVNEYAVRLPAALSALLGLGFLGWLGGKLFGRRAGALVLAVTASSLGYLALGQLAIIDMTLTVLLTAGMGFFLLAVRGPGEGRGWALCGWTALGLAVLAKGLIGIMLPAGGLAAYVLLRRDWRAVRRVVSLPGIGLFLLVAAPWFAAVSAVNPEFPRYFFIHEHLERFLGMDDKKAFHAEPFWYFFPVLAGFLLPWTVFLPRILRNIPGRVPEEKRDLLFLMCWGGVIFIFFSLSSSKLPSYILPCLPPLGLLMGRELDRALSRSPERGWRSEFLAAAGMMLFAGLALAGYPILVAAPRLAPGACFWAASGLILAAAAILAVFPLSPRAGIWTLAAAFLIAGSAGTAVLRVSVGKDRSTAFLARHALKLRRNDQPFYSFDFYAQGFPFYARERLVLGDTYGELEFGSAQGDQSAWFLDRDDFSRVLRGDEQVFVVTRDRYLADLNSLAPGLLRLAGKSGNYRLVTNR